MRAEAGDREDAKDLARQAAAHGDTNALFQLAMARERAGDRKIAEYLVRQAADHGNTYALYRLAEIREFLARLWPYGLNPDGTPTSRSVSCEDSGRG